MTWEDRPELSAVVREEGICKTGSFVIRNNDSKSWTAKMISRDKALFWILILMRLGMLALEDL